MKTSPEKSFLAYVAAVVGIWIVFTAAWAGYVFLLPHQPAFASEIGKNGAFLAFLVLYSIPYYFVAGVLGFAVFVGSSASSGSA